MVMTVQNFLELPITKGFEVVVGERFLRNKMKNVEILDFEFIKGFENTREKMFTEDSLVLSSLLFAQNEPSLLVEMIHRFAELHISAFAYKPVIYEDLPQEVLDLAVEKQIPILKFGGDEFFEDIIFQALNYRTRASQVEFLETTVARLIEDDIDSETQSTLIRQLNRPFESYVYVVSISSPQIDHYNVFRLEPFLRTGLITRYKQQIILVMTNHSSSAPFYERMMEILQICKKELSEVKIGLSNVYETETQLANALQEAFYANLFAQLYNKKEFSYQSLKTEKLLIELMKKQPVFVKQYMEEFIEPLEEWDHFLDTAITYVLQEGNIKAVAEVHYCHPNTIRYRITKMKSILSPEVNEMQFFEQLSVAIKLYLLKKHLDL